MPDPLLQTYLADRDTQCPSCGYNLRGLTGEHCPECAQKLVLHVGLADPVGKSWVVGLIGLAFGAGFFDVMVCFIIIMSLHENDWPPARMVWPIFVSAAVLSAALWGWVHERPALRRKSAAAQSWAATWCWAATIVCAGVTLWILIRR